MKWIPHSRHFECRIPLGIVSGAGHGAVFRCRESDAASHSDQSARSGGFLRHRLSLQCEEQSLPPAGLRVQPGRVSDMVQVREPVLRALPKIAFESIVHYVYVRQDRAHLEPRSGGGNIAQGGAGTAEPWVESPPRASPERAAGSSRPTLRPVDAHFHGGIMKPRSHEKRTLR